MYMTPSHLQTQSHTHLSIHPYTHAHTCWLVAPSAKVNESTSPSMKSLPMEATTVVTEPMSDSINYTTNTQTLSRLSSAQHLFLTLNTAHTHTHTPKAVHTSTHECTAPPTAAAPLTPMLPLVTVLAVTVLAVTELQARKERALQQPSCVCVRVCACVCVRVRVCVCVCVCV